MVPRQHIWIVLTPNEQNWDVQELSSRLDDSVNAFDGCSQPQHLAGEREENPDGSQNIAKEVSSVQIWNSSNVKGNPQC